tara:strand:- start:4597 stop:5793 length:1197 start_codon:yes stop_codon:yes gene_type:complete
MGRRSGKSYMAAHEVLPWLLTPNTRGWIVGPNYSLANKIAREVKRVIMTELRIPVESKKEISGDLYYMKLAGLNSELVVKSADAPDSLIGEGIDYLICDEMALIPRNTFEMYLRPTLSDRQGWALFCSTPRGFNYLHKLYEYGQSTEYPEWQSWRFPSTASPYFKDDHEELKRTLTKETYLQEILCEFQSYAGKVYPMDRFSQVTEKAKYDPSKPVYVGLDFGYRHSAAVIVQLHNQQKNFADVYQIDELNLQNVRTEEFARKLNSLGYTYTGIWGDPAGSGTNLQSGISDIAVFQKNSLKVNVRRDAVTRNVVSGVSHVRRWFEDANGDAHLFINPKCKASIEAYENYHYPEHRENQTLRHEPQKDGKFDHHCDALRFLLTNLFPMKNRHAGVIDFF